MPRHLAPRRIPDEDPALREEQAARDHLTQVEHFQNQFDIQLRNIHDLKLNIKSHERKIQADNSGEEIYGEHEQLLNEFLSLESTLQELRDEFRNFVNNTSC